MSGLMSSSASGRASPDALVAAACHYRTVNLPTLVIGPADSVPVLAIGLVTKDFKVSASIRSNSWIVGYPEINPLRIFSRQLFWVSSLHDYRVADYWSRELRGSAAPRRAAHQCN